MTIERQQDIRWIIDKFGHCHQIEKAKEELSELIKELCKDSEGEGDKQHITEEIADVLLMMDQLITMYNIDRKEVDEIIDFKIERTIERVKTGIRK